MATGDNIWNQTSKLSPEFYRFSSENIDPKKTFKKTIRDLPKVIQQEREDKFQGAFNKIMKEKQDGFERYSARKLERFIQQYQCSQGLSDEQIEQIKKIEETDPQLFDELSSKKKWTFVSKNTNKAIKDQKLNNSYWNLLNHMPKQQVSNIVTKRVLAMDKNACDNQLNAILDQKKQEDTKQSIIQRER